MIKELTLAGIMTFVAPLNPLITGSIFVIPNEYATNEPAADPLPGPTGIRFSRAKRI